MTSIKRIFFIALFSYVLACLHGQSIHFAVEIERLESLALSPSLKHDALVRLARLYHLSGNREKALENWLKAARAEPDRQDDAALLEGIRVLISMGEFDRAGMELEAVLESGDEKTREAARLLGAQLEAFRGKNPAPLSFYAGVPAYSYAQSGLLFTLWKISGNDSWKNRLLSGFPGSIEAEIARGKRGIRAAASMQWLFFPVRESLALAAPVHSAAREPGAAGVMLQTGLFSREANARGMATRLAGAGFKPEVTRRSLNGSEYWAVYVPAGSDVNLAINQLKSAGFESFPVF